MIIKLGLSIIAGYILASFLLPSRGFAKQKQKPIVINADKMIKEGKLKRLPGGKLCKLKDIQVVDGIEYCTTPYSPTSAPDKPMPFYPSFPSSIPSKSSIHQLPTVGYPPPQSVSPLSVKNVSYKPDTRLSIA